jgi:amino acid transporter
MGTLAQDESEGTNLLDGQKKSYKLNAVALGIMGFFWLSGGIYGNEEMMLDAEPRDALPLLIVTPILYSLPMMMVISELASALPMQGGHVAWVKEVIVHLVFSPNFAVTDSGVCFTSLTQTGLWSCHWRAHQILGLAIIFS